MSDLPSTIGPADRTPAGRIGFQARYNREVARRNGREPAKRDDLRRLGKWTPVQPAVAGEDPPPVLVDGITEPRPLTRELLDRYARDFEPQSMQCSRCKMNCKHVRGCPECDRVVCVQCWGMGWHRCDANPATPPASHAL